MIIWHGIFKSIFSWQVMKMLQDAANCGSQNIACMRCVFKFFARFEGIVQVLYLSPFSGAYIIYSQVFRCYSEYILVGFLDSVTAAIREFYMSCCAKLKYVDNQVIAY